MANRHRDADAAIMHAQCLPAAGKFTRLGRRERSLSSRMGSLYSSRFHMTIRVGLFAAVHESASGAPIGPTETVWYLAAFGTNRITAIYEYTSFCNGPGDVKSPRVSSRRRAHASVRGRR